MPKLMALLLVLANLGYYAWSNGLLAAYGFAPSSQSEPQRLTQQIKPEALNIVPLVDTRQVGSAPPATPASAASATPSAGTSASASAATECLQVGLFNDAQTVVLKQRLASTLPAGSWALEAGLEPARWLVYMGKYSSAELVDKKKAELRGMGLSFANLGNTALEPGLSLGSFTTQAEAEAELTRITKKGVKTAKVLQDRVEQRGQKLKLPAVTAALRSQLDALKPQLAGKAFQACT